jgi:hypothetical protein
MNLRMDSPGAPGSATGANEMARESFLASDYSAYPSVLTRTLIWDRGAGSIERLELVRQGGWA